MRKDAITLLCFFVFSVQTCYGNDRANDPWFLKCASDYALEGWRGRTDAKYYKRVDKLDLTQIPIPFLEKTHFTIETVKNDNIESLYFLKCEKIEPRVDIHFLENIYSAHDEIISIIAGMSSMPFFMVCNNLGDKGFKKRDSLRSHIIFARNNVVVAIKSEIEENQTAKIAKQIDQEILKQSGVMPKATPATENSSAENFKINDMDSDDAAQSN